VCHNGYWFWGCPSPEDLRQDLRSVTQKIRPDWDLAAPEIRANWDGDRTKHWPYVDRKRMRRTSPRFTEAPQDE
jgi:hypothetical protein